MLELLLKRRSIRRFKDKNVEQEKIHLIESACLTAPSSKKRQPWEFVVVDDKVLLERLSEAREHGSRFLKGAPLAFVVLADPDKSDVWIEDAVIAALLIQLESEYVGLGSCWIQIRDRQGISAETAEEHVQSILGIPGNLKVECIIAVGYPDEHKPAYTFEDLLVHRVHHNQYGLKG